MQSLILIIAGVIIGGIIGWLLGAHRARTETINKITESERRASEAEARLAVIQSQLQQTVQEETQLRNRLELEQAQRITIETTLKETQARLTEQQRFLEEAKDRLSETFKALAGDTLNTTHTTFLNMSKQVLENILTEARGELAKREDAIKILVTPLAESLKQYEEHIGNIEKKRIEAYSSLETYLKTLSQTQQQLQKETTQLVNALRSSAQVRGRWGELTLRRLVEMAGMNQYSDFTLQATVDSEDGRLRPDLVVKLPSNRLVVVDAKVSLDAYLNALASDDESKRKELLAQHAKHIRDQLKRLADKAYWQQFQQAPEFVVMFIPADSFLNSALEFDPSLLEDGLSRRVILATPSSLMALLLTVAYGWRQEQLARNAEQISELGKTLYERIKIVFFEHFAKVGEELEKAVKAFNSAVSSFETRLLPSARRFTELGVSKETELPPIKQIDVQSKKLHEDK